MLTEFVIKLQTWYQIWGGHDKYVTRITICFKFSKWLIWLLTCIASMMRVALEPTPVLAALHTLLLTCLTTCH